MNVSLVSQVNESISPIRQGLFTQPIMVKLSEEVAKSLRNAFYEAIATNTTSDIGKQFEAIFGGSCDSVLEIAATVRITEVFGEFESRPTVPYPEFEIIIVSGCSGIGAYENIYEDKNITISIGRI